VVLELKPAESNDQIAAVAALHDPVRRALYEHVARQPEAVSRDHAARALGISRLLAAFHLDKLVRAGLLTASYRRVSGRQGPGAGRPSKFYGRSQREIGVTLPQRRYELVARLFAQALEDPRAVPAREALYEAARVFGADLGQNARRRAGRRATQGRLLRLAQEQLEANGYEPYRDGQAIRLRNCPFDQIAQSHRSLTCGANLGLIQGFLSGLELPGVQAGIEPAAGRCCVALRPVDTRTPDPAA
jgi:predicted ArsR family transcriptional regulator